MGNIQQLCLEFVHAFNEGQKQNEGKEGNSPNEDLQEDWVQKCQEFQDALWKTCDQKLETQETKLASIFDSNASHSLFLQKISDLHIDLLQNEIQKFPFSPFSHHRSFSCRLFSVLKFGWEFVSTLEEKKTAWEEIVTLSCLDLRSTIPVPLEKAMHPKSGFKFPTEEMSFGSVTENVQKAVKLCWVFLDLIKSDFGMECHSSIKTKTTNKNKEHPLSLKTFIQDEIELVQDR